MSKEIIVNGRTFLVDNKYGTDTLRAVVKYAGETHRKIKKFTADGKYTFGEKLRSFSILAGAFDLILHVDAIWDEFTDLNEEEKAIVVTDLVEQFGWSFEKSFAFFEEFCSLLRLVLRFTKFGKEKDMPDGDPVVS